MHHGPRDDRLICKITMNRVQELQFLEKKHWHLIVPRQSSTRNRRGESSGHLKPAQRPPALAASCHWQLTPHWQSAHQRLSSKAHGGAGSTAATPGRRVYRRGSCASLAPPSRKLMSGWWSVQWIGRLDGSGVVGGSDSRGWCVARNKPWPQAAPLGPLVALFFFGRVLVLIIMMPVMIPVNPT